jgi:carboxypeptidase Taq
MPSKRFRLDVSTHPFSIRIAGDDVRITTRYEPKNFKASMFGLIHECGHALYELQVDHDLDFTPIGGGVSAGLHESQSRFWENIVGRSRPFLSMSYPILKADLHLLSLYEEDQVYFYFNSVRPSLVRVEADELTYNFHIVMRYELEKKLLEGKVSVSELPQVWDDMIESYVGKRPKNNADGVLQDVHWSWGQFATFPGYSLGNVVAGMLWKKLTDQGLLPINDEESIVALKGWLAENIHKPGSTYAPKELLTKVFGMGYDPSGLVGYLENKYIAMK